MSTQLSFSERVAGVAVAPNKDHTAFYCRSRLGTWCRRADGWWIETASGFQKVSSYDVHKYVPTEIRHAWVMSAQGARWVSHVTVH